MPPRAARWPVAPAQPGRPDPAESASRRHVAPARAPPAPPPRPAVPGWERAVRAPARRSVYRVKQSQGQTQPKLPGTPTVYSLYHSAGESGTRAQSHAHGTGGAVCMSACMALHTSDCRHAASRVRAESRPLVSTRSRVPCRQVHRLRVADRAACRPFPATDHHHSSIIIRHRRRRRRRRRHHHRALSSTPALRCCCCSSLLGMISFVVVRGRVLLSANIRPSGRSLSGQRLVAILLEVLRLPGQRPTTNARRLGGEQPRPAASKGARRAVRVTTVAGLSAVRLKACV